MSEQSSNEPEQSPNDLEQNLNISGGSSLENSQVGGIAGRDLKLTQIKGQVVYVTVRDSIDASEGLGQSTDRSADSLTREECRYRQTLLNTVKRDWVDGYLQQSLYNKVLIEVGLREQHDAVEPQSLRGLVESPVLSKSALLEDTDATRIFEQIGSGRTLLILGEPGSGKTITLLKIVQSLVGRAEGNLGRSIPVVFNLSSWNLKRQPIDEWLVEELLLRYSISKEVSEKWVKKQELILMLDGLDEVKAEDRNTCVKALNEFIQSHGLMEMVVCCRFQEYQSLSERLDLKGAICINPLTIEQVYQYLNNTGNKLEKIKTAIQQSSVLQELATSPLVLNLMVLTYEDCALGNFSRFNSEKEYLNSLFSAYIEKMFRIHPATQRYSKKKTIIWLIWLAKKMSQESQTVFFIEGLQPSWLEENLYKALYVFTVTFNLFLVFSLSSYFVTMPLFSSSQNLENSSVGTEIGWFLLLLAFPVYLLVMSWNLMFQRKCTFFEKVASFWSKITSIDGFLAKQLAHVGVFLKLYYQLFLRNIFLPNIEPIEEVSWSLEKGKKALTKYWFSSVIFWFLFSFTLFVIICIVVAISMILDGISTGYFWESLIEVIFFTIKDIIFFLIVSIVMGFAYGILFVPLYFVLGGVSYKVGTDNYTFPNQGIWRSAKNVLFLSIIGAFFGGFVLLPNWGILLLTQQFTSTQLLFYVLSQSFNHAILLGFLAGAACNKHFVLRLILFLRRKMPWNYASFLDYGAERLFLRKVGGGYMFIHRMLMEHFAQMELEQGQR